MASSNMDTALTSESVCQKAYTIGGVPIIFPYKAYPSQITMMDKIVRCLNKKYNCLLESPTGSGKSLALLCATLAWLRKAEKEMREMELVLDKHLNAYGVVANSANNAAQDIKNIKVDFEKYKFGQSHPPEISKKSNFHDELVNTNIEKEKFSSEVWSPYFNPSDKVIKSNTLDRKVVTPNAKTLEKQEGKVHDSVAKRGIVYIDDDDLEDFKPLKKTRLSTSVHENCELICQSTECKQQCSETIPVSHNVHEHSDISNKFDSSYEASSKVTPENNETLPPKLPKIYFGTRTHKQIGQIIRELKKTPYKDVRMTILSSRERTCIHPVNSKSRNKNDGCQELINRDEGPACSFYKNLQKTLYYNPPEMQSAFDLEDFVSMCQRKRICPYFGAREMLDKSDIIFCPYNYLVDPLIRSALNIHLKGNVIIMDEAHNIEDSAREAASFSISTCQLTEVIADVLQIGQLKDDNSEPYMFIAKVLENLKKWLDNSQDLNDYVSFDSSCKVWSGDDMIAVLEYIGIGPDTFPLFKKRFLGIMKEESENEKEKLSEIEVPKLSGPTQVCLKNLTEILNYLYKDALKYVPDYRCVVMKSKTYSNERNMMSLSQSSKKKTFSKPEYEITMNFWCLNPAVAFSDMNDVHSVIVASGTLAPLTSFQSELGIPFQISIEANHVICKDNIWVGTIGKGPSNNSLNGTFQNASTFAFQDDVGSLVLEVCGTIPHGVLCFLPSYGMLDKLVSRWQCTGLWNKLMCKKTVLCEPRRANEDFQQVIQEFYEAVKDSESDECSDNRGALFLAVCRGKVSEGLDFADNNARAVITIGIPFPNVKDAQVDLKKKYNDVYASKRQIVSGGAWYEMQAFRALNQALGRCIRHRNDFGALIIVDDRFQKYDRYVGALSKWIKKEIRHYPNFYDALSSLTEFADRMGLKNKFETY